MLMTCPCCGARFSLDACSLDEDARYALAAIADLGGLAPSARRYLALWRKPDSKRGLTWHKTRRIAEELRAMVQDQSIQWEGRRILANKPDWWARAMDTILDRDSQGKITRPLTSHNLLRSIAYSAADKAAEASLRQREEGLRHPSSAAQTRAVTDQPKRTQGNPTPMPADFMDRLHKMQGGKS